MADKKISALTSAATPLAGSEVLPIVQSGSTVKVSVANLTVGRAVTATDFTARKAAGGTLVLDSTAVGTTSNIISTANNGNALADLNYSANTHNWNYGATPLASTDPNGTYKIFTLGSECIRVSINDMTNYKGNYIVGTAGKGIVDSTGTTSLQFTSLQVVSNKTIIAPSFTTAAGDTASTPTATPVTLFTPSGDGVWIVNALVTLTGAPAAYIASSMIKASGGVLAATAISTATNMTISVSGANVQATQTSGGDQIIAFSYIRLF